MSNFDEVAEKIRDRECALFLGAGCSIGSRAPAGQTLLEVVRNQFRVNSKLVTDLQTTFDFACGRDEINRLPVETFLWELFSGLKPNIGHQIMAKFRWPAIFTTNYDRLVETVYSNVEAAQTLIPVHNESDTTLELNNEISLPLFKLFGSISTPGTPPQHRLPLILTTKDSIEFQQDRAWMLESLERLAGTNTWLIIGYSFSDGVLRNFLMDLRSSPGWKYHPKCFVVLPEVTSDDKDYLQTYKLELIPDTFEGFFNKLDLKYREETRRLLYATKVSTNPAILGKQFGDLDPRQRLEMDQQFVLVDDELIEKDNGELLFKGYTPSWGDIARGSDIPRKEAKKITDAIINDLTQEIQEPKFYVLASAAGSGKSTLLKRIGYDFYKRGMLVIMLRPYEQWKLETIEKLFDHFNRRILIIVDDAHLCYGQAITLFNKIRTHNLPITMLLGLRKGDHNVLAGKRQPFEEVQPDFSLSYRLEDNDEFRQLLFALEKRGFIKFDLGRDVEYWMDHFRQTADCLILVILMEATLNKKFDEIVLDEYAALSGNVAQQAYSYICAMHQYDIPLKQHLLRAALQCDWNILLRDIHKGIAELTIIENGSSSSEPFYESRHHLIAEKVAHAIFNSREKLTAVIEKIISAAYPHEVTDEQAVLDILRNDDLLTDVGELNLKRRLFTKAVERFPTSGRVLLHYGMLLCQEDLCDESEDVLTLAKKTDPENIAIIHYLGILYRTKARNTPRANSTLRRKLFKDAEYQFEVVCRKDPSNEYGYHAHAEMLLDIKRKEFGITDEEADELLNRALDITTRGLKLVPRHSQRLLEDLHNALLGELGDIPKARAYFKARTESGAGPDTWALWARTELGSKNLDEALNVIRQALSKFKDNVGIILIAGDLAESLMDEKGDVCEENIKYLQDSANKLFERSDVRLRYAVALFQAGKHIEAEQEFHKAFKILPDGFSATSATHYWVDNSGIRKEFIGQTIHRQRESNWEAKTTIGWPIHLSSTQILSRGVIAGQDIHFFIAFNYYGPIGLLK